MNLKFILLLTSAKGNPHYSREKDTLPGIPKNFSISGMQNDDLSWYFQLPLPPAPPKKLIFS